MAERALRRTISTRSTSRACLHPNTNLAALHRGGPLVLVRGKGVHVWDNHGKQYIEAMAGLWCTTLGYGDDELARTAYEQIKKLSFSHLFTGKSHEPGDSAGRQARANGAVCGVARVLRQLGLRRQRHADQARLVLQQRRWDGRRRRRSSRATKGYHGTTLGVRGAHGLAVVSQAVRRAAAAVPAHRRALLLSRRGARRERGRLRDAARARASSS